MDLAGLANAAACSRVSAGFCEGSLPPIGGSMAWLNREWLGVYPKIICVFYLLTLRARATYISAVPGCSRCGRSQRRRFFPLLGGLFSGPDGRAAAVYDPERFLAAQKEFFHKGAGEGQRQPGVEITGGYPAHHQEQGGQRQ